MGQVLIRELDDKVIERLKERASANHRSFEAELREILENVTLQADLATASELAERIRARLKMMPISDSAELIREDRDR